MHHTWGWCKKGDAHLPLLFCKTTQHSAWPPDASARTGWGPRIKGQGGKAWQPWLTLEVQVAGAVGVLCDGAGVNLERVDIVDVTGHNDIVPLVVVDRLV